MAITPTLTLPGQAVTGLTTPTYTLSTDVAPNVNSKQWAVTALGGTQTGVDAHSVSKPFTMTVQRPAVVKALPVANPLTGVIKSIPINLYKLRTRKGAVPLTNQAARLNLIETSFSVTAGCETFEPEELLAMISAHIGFLIDQRDNLVIMMKTGTI